MKISACQAPSAWEINKEYIALWDKGLSYIISSFKFFDFGLSLKYHNQYQWKQEAN